MAIKDSFEPTLCAICGKPRGTRPKYCSEECASTARWERELHYRQSLRGREARARRSEADKAHRAKVKEFLAEQARLKQQQKGPATHGE